MKRKKGKSDGDTRILVSSLEVDRSYESKFINADKKEGRRGRSRVALLEIRLSRDFFGLGKNGCFLSATLSTAEGRKIKVPSFLVLMGYFYWLLAYHKLAGKRAQGTLNTLCARGKTATARILSPCGFSVQGPESPISSPYWSTPYWSTPYTVS